MLKWFSSLMANDTETPEGWLYYSRSNFCEIDRTKPTVKKLVDDGELSMAEAIYRFIIRKDNP
jgi:hypothetical protein